jgi:hypothetical protein
MIYDIKEDFKGKTVLYNGKLIDYVIIYNIFLKNKSNELQTYNVGLRSPWVYIQWTRVARNSQF